MKISSKLKNVQCLKPESAPRVVQISFIDLPTEENDNHFTLHPQLHLKLES